MIEIFKPVKNWEGLYEVSNLGRVRSVSRVILRRDGSSQHFQERILTNRLSSNGYLLVRLSDDSNGRRSMARVHRLVAEAFLANPHELPEVNHIDSNRANPRLDNLEWVTRSQNLYHGYHFGHVSLPHRVGERSNSSKLSDQKVIEIRALAQNGNSSRKLARDFGVDKSTVLAILKGKTWSHVANPHPPPSPSNEGEKA